MKESIKKFLLKRFPRADLHEAEVIAIAVVEHICTPEFSALYAQRTKPWPDLGLGPLVNSLWSKAMSAQTEAFAAAVANLQSKLGASGLPADQVDAHIHAVVDPLTDKITAIANSEADDASKVADIQTELASFTSAFAPATGGDGTAGTAAGSTAAGGNAA